MKRKLIGVALMAVSAGAMLPACSTEPKTSSEKSTLQSDALAALNGFKNADSSLQAELDRAAGYAIFPDIGKGGFIAGGAYGRGVVFEHGRMVGYCDMTQGTLGLQAGAQTYSMLIIFRDQSALDQFKSGKFAFAANASAVAIKAGAAAAANYQNGVAVFTQTKGGVMAEAALGGQQFTFRPL